MKFKEVDILTFIEDFKKFGTGKEIEDCFSNGYCYYFAIILKERFPEGEIFYNITNHFVFKYNNEFYDITGNCTQKYNNWGTDSWKGYIELESDSSHLKSLIQSSIKKNIPID